MNVEDSAITLFQHTRKAPIMQSQSTNQSLDFVPNGLLFSNTNDTGYQVGDGDGASTGGTIDERVEDEDELMESGSDYYSADEIQMAVDKRSITSALEKKHNHPPMITLPLLDQHRRTRQAHPQRIDKETKSPSVVGFRNR